MYLVITLSKTIRFCGYFLVTISLLLSGNLYAQKTVASSAALAGFSMSMDKVSANGAMIEPVIYYQQQIHMLAVNGDMPSLSVFGDGRVLVHYPVYMKRAGDYEMQLGETELVSLVRSLSTDGVMRFDDEKVKASKRNYEQSLKAKGQFYAISDAVVTSIDIRLDEYQENKSANKIKNFRKSMRWENIEQDAKRYKNISEIVESNKSVSNLKNLMKDQRLLKKITKRVKP